ncbi:hypothetical protein [Streptomyces sp. SCL15-4]|uniref:hypothetical protein n=1 Tax=Streptomyces sp. SCL15-4 TaxID=2967221 RepID=UPI0029671599|nr:hypothetical protein [Streptomyces sp. SCL15-4]
MAENDDYRTVIREDEDGTRHIAIVRRDPETDQLTDDQIITDLQEWRAKREQPERERWPMPRPFGEWLMATKPGPKGPCPECGCYGLRRGANPAHPDDEKVICTNSNCEACPWYSG